ncbi:MAG: serine/threonine protein kinase [Labilithrix sp.]|nr:serine/threonine protein kinase [Labilithrix sp.]
MSAPVDEGDLLAGKYRVTRVLGRGGMGVVVAAVHEVLGHRVALKFILPEALGHHDTLERFLREARIVAKLQTEHVARVSDVGTLETGAPYIVMEYLDGEDLAAVLLREGPLAPVRVVDYVLQVLDALAEAHACGVVHRDLKPANLFAASRHGAPPVLKVLDFGISKEVTLAPNALTQTTNTLGSPVYMSPEQVKSTKSVDRRSDLWAIGVIMYELLGGRLPFDGVSYGEVFARILDPAPPVRIESLRADLPPGLAQIVHRLLEKDLELRFQNAAALASALMRYASAAGALAGRRAIAIGGGASDATDVVAEPRAPQLGPAPNLHTARLPSSPSLPGDGAPPLVVNTATTSPWSQSTPALQPRPPGGGPPGYVVASFALVSLLGIAGIVVAMRRAPPPPATGMSATSTAEVAEPGSAVPSLPSAPSLITPPAATSTPSSMRRAAPSGVPLVSPHPPANTRPQRTTGTSVAPAPTKNVWER